VSGDYRREKLANAMSALGASAAPLVDRVANAVLALTPLEPSDFVDERGRATFTSIDERITVHENESLGSIRETASRMSEEQLLSVAEDLVALASTEIYRLSDD
jgi:hypothetical protein